MGVAELIALCTLIATIGGGVWGSFSALNSHLSGFRSDLAVIKWRLLRLEKKNSSDVVEVEQ